LSHEGKLKQTEEGKKDVSGLSDEEKERAKEQEIEVDKEESKTAREGKENEETETDRSNEGICNTLYIWSSLDVF